MFGRACTFTGIPAGVSFRADSCAFSGDGVMLAVAINVSPYIWLFKREETTFTKLPDLLDPPPGTGSTWPCQSCAWGGDYLAVALNESPYVAIYKRDGDTLTKLLSPSALPAGAAGGVAFSADGVYLAVVHKVAPNITVYKRSGDTFAKLSTPSVSPSSRPNNNHGACTFSADGVYLAMVPQLDDKSGSLVVFKRSGDTFTRLADPPGTLALYDAISFSADGSLLAGARSLYRRNGNAFAQISQFAADDWSNISLNLAGTALATSRGYQTGTIRARVYKISGDVVAEDLVSGIPVGLSSVRPVAHAFSPDGQILICGYWGLCGWVKDTDAIPQAPIPTSPPDQSYVRIDADNEFVWTHVNEFGTPQTRADLQMRTSGGDWQDLATVVGASQKVLIPGDTFISGTNQWRVRTYNTDDIPGEWSAAITFVGVGAPPAPTIITITNAARPVVMWASFGQGGYQLQISKDGNSIWDSGIVSGGIRTHKIPAYLQNGMYIAQIRITNASMLWSAWAEQEFTIDVTGPAKPALTAEATAGAAVLAFAATGAEKLYLLRDGIPIANVTGKTEYTDYAALGSTVYVLRAVDASDNYTDSDPVGVTVAVPCVMMAAVDALTEIVQMQMKKNDQPGVSRQKDVMGSAHYYAGRTRPVYRFSGFVGEQYSPAFYYTTSTDFARLEALIDKRLTILYRDNLGNKYYGVITGITHTQENYMYEFALAIMRVDYVEQIGYEV